MIEIVSPSLCTGCNICFMCELYCPADALYVAPDADAPVIVAESLLQQRGLMGSYRRAVGWKGGLITTADEDHSYALLALVR